MGRLNLATNVYETAVNRLVNAYRDGNVIVSTFSGGKDSGVVVELHIEAARRTGNLPVDVVMRDEEIMLPGTFEYAERVAARREVRFHWVYACQPIINIYNRREPFWWVFDPFLDSSDWVRLPPDGAERIHNNDIETICGAQRFPAPAGKKTIVLMGLRTAESLHRLRGIHSAGGWLNRRPTKHGVYYGKPIYDWLDGDVWKAVKEREWDYNHAYDVMARMGIAKNHLRIAPPTMNEASLEILQVAFKAWPRWAERLCARLPGIRAGVQYGMVAIRPHKRLGETWEQCFMRECIEEAPDWIANRASRVAEKVKATHRKHSTTPVPDVVECYHCPPGVKCWKTMAKTMYNGDAFCSKQGVIEQVQPEFFRAGAGTWGSGSPSW